MLSANTPTLLDSPGFERFAFNIFEKEKTLFAPLEIRATERAGPMTQGRCGTITIAWQGREIRFRVEIKSRTAPKIVQAAFWKFRDLSNAERQNFLLVVPYITPTIREMVERETVSCIDLSGNYLIQNSEFLAVRVDRKNRFPESASIKKIFSGNSSQVGRLFLTKNRIYKSVNEVFESIGRLGGGLSLSAVSKVLSALQDELVIEKTNQRIVLLQPDKLLARLQEEYVAPKSLVQLKLKIPGKGKEVLRYLANKLSGKMWMISGECSIEKYTMTTPTSVFRAYVIEASELSKYEDTRFYNVILEATSEPYVYFDRQFSAKDKLCWASRLQTYLELSRMDKREREIAESIREEILKEFK